MLSHVCMEWNTPPCQWKNSATPETRETTNSPVVSGVA